MICELGIAAVDIAARAHAGQTDRFTGEIYLLHPIRVARRVMAAGGSDRAILGAILHDVLEDAPKHLTGYFENEIRSLFGESMVNLVKILSRLDGESYSTYIRRCAEDADAKIIKECDLDDHLDLDRLHKKLDEAAISGIISEYGGMFKKYEKAKRIINQ